MKAFAICLVFVYAVIAKADGTCFAINYQCDLQKKELRIASESMNCGSGPSPFTFSDSKLSGLYNGDHIKKPIVKECPLGTKPVIMVITAGCVPSVSIYRDAYISFDKAGNIETKIHPIAYVPEFGFMCGPLQDRYTMIFGKIVVKLTQSEPTELFSVELTNDP